MYKNNNQISTKLTAHHFLTMLITTGNGKVSTGNNKKVFFRIEETPFSGTCSVYCCTPACHKRMAFRQGFRAKKIFNEENFATVTYFPSFTDKI